MADSVIATLCDRVRMTANNFDWTDAQITEWVRYAEERFNNELRDVSMKVIATAVADDYRIDIPPDWLETIWLRFQPDQDVSSLDDAGTLIESVAKGKPLRSVTSDYFNSVTNDIDDVDYRMPLFMQHGAKIFLNPRQPALNGRTYEMGYYQSVTPLAEAPTKLWSRASNMYLTATLAYGSMYDVEDERAGTWDAMASQSIKTLNEYTKRVQMGGGPMRKRIKSFG